MYLVKAPWFLKALYPSFTWHIKTKEKILYLTFDDGPHETATPFVLDELKKYNAHATFFCIGKNVAAYPAIYERIRNEGHATGNHTWHHLNGWETEDDYYINDIKEAATCIPSDLFRPPYGRIKRSQWSKLKNQWAPNRKLNIVMWDVLSGDFDVHLQPKRCLANVLYHSKPGSIIVFHDSTKAWKSMSYALPRMLEHFSKQGYQFKTIST
jgi:peptidoglycan/xylan/chitin deacetylase (PgdA/CDA1 family)